jgi:hypothetical protein
MDATAIMSREDIAELTGLNMTSITGHILEFAAAKLTKLLGPLSETETSEEISIFDTTNTIYLPIRPISQVTKVEYTTYGLATPTPVDPDEYRSIKREGLILFSFNFTPGCIVEVTYKYGITVTPLVRVIYAAIVAEFVLSLDYSNDTFAVTRKRIGDYEVSYSRAIKESTTPTELVNNLVNLYFNGPDIPSVEI